MPVQSVTVSQVVASAALLESARPKAHDRHELVYVAKGAYAVEVGGDRLIGGPGDVFGYPAGTVHRPCMPLHSATRILLLQWLPADGAAGLVAVARAHDGRGRLLMLLTWALDLTLEDTADARGLRDELATVIVREFGRLLAGGEQSDPIGRVMRAMEENLGNRALDLRTLARLAHMTPGNFCRAFRTRTEDTPFGYLRRLRVEAAEALIRDTDLPLEEIAARVGFCNASHLSRTVSAHAGLPPSALRRGTRA